MTDKRFIILKNLGVGDFQHLNGDLECHLKNTAAILKDWGADEFLQTAGLFHAAYGTAGFEQNMVGLEQREFIAQTIGGKEEALVYLYCSCDRDEVFPQFGHAKRIRFKDRFTQKRFTLPEEDTRLFCELTVANELELVYASEAFKAQHGDGLHDLFQRMQPYLSPAATNAVQQAFSGIRKCDESPV